MVKNVHMHTHTITIPQSGLLKKRRTEGNKEKKKVWQTCLLWHTATRTQTHCGSDLLIMTGLPFRARYRSRRAAEQVAHRNLHCYAEQISVPFGASARTLPPSHITHSQSKDILYALFPLMGRGKEGKKKKKKKKE